MLRLKKFIIGYFSAFKFSSGKCQLLCCNSIRSWPRLTAFNGHSANKKVKVYVPSLSNCSKSTDKLCDSKFPCILLVNRAIVFFWKCRTTPFSHHWKTTDVIQNGLLLTVYLSSNKVNMAYFILCEYCKPGYLNAQPITDSAVVLFVLVTAVSVWIFNLNPTCTACFKISLMWFEFFLTLTHILFKFYNMMTYGIIITILSGVLQCWLF